MNQNNALWFRILFLGFFFSTSQLMFSELSSNQGNFVVKLPFFEPDRFFIQEMLRDHPIASTVISGALIASVLYYDEIINTVWQHKQPVVAGTMATVFGASMYQIYCGEQSLENQDDSSFDQLAKFSMSGVRVYKPGEIKVRFSDVAGLHSAKEDLNDIKLFLQNPHKFKKIGAKVPKGVLLSGAPGNGKTLLARALAGEVGCPFLYIAGSEFVEAIVGVGAARIRHLFEVARKCAPCIIFIDEIDAIGLKRSNRFNSNGDTQALLQLLAEMDGFEKNDKPVIVIGATNRKDMLDEALLRPGRFDRKILIEQPFLQDRFDILAVHLKKVKAINNIDIYKLALATQGFSSADLAELVNEAAILAIRDNAAFVTMNHFDQARDYMLLGRETKGMQVDQEEYWVTAVHEAGHALMHVYLKDATALYKVTITPRGGALGLTYGYNPKEKYSHTEKELRAMIQIALGGSVAEEMIFNHRGVGIMSDLNAARSYATAMVMKYGMTNEFKDVSFDEFIDNQFHLPDEVSTILQKEVAKIIHECRAVTYATLQAHKAELLALAQKLLEQGTVVGSDVYKLCQVPEPTIVYSLSA